LNLVRLVRNLIFILSVSFVTINFKNQKDNFELLYVLCVCVCVSERERVSEIRIMDMHLGVGHKLIESSRSRV